MKSHIVAIFGPTGSGKDTFAAALRDKFEEAEVTSMLESSIDIVKDFFDRVRDVLNLDSPEEIDKNERQSLADIKAVLDRQFEWTAMYAIKMVPHSGVLLYQVREIENINLLRIKCQSHHIEFSAIHMYRPGYNRPGATTDTYGPDAWKIADHIIINRHLQDMAAAATHVSAVILREMLET